VRAQCSSNTQQHTFQIPDHFIVPEPQHDEASVGKPSVSFHVSFLVAGMLATIKFHNDTRFEANEIDDVVSKRLLTSPLGIEETPRA
jgi:hypothetical protein